MAQQVSISNLSDSEQFVVLENVFDYISDVATLVSLTLVSKRVRSVVYRSNGLREMKIEVIKHSYDCACNYCYNGYCRKVNGVHIKSGSIETHQKGVEWLWTIGKRLKVVRLRRDFSFRDVFPVVNNLAVTQKRRIKTIEVSGIPYEMVIDLVRENRNTLRCLSDWSISESSEIETFWSVVQQCKRLESMNTGLNARDPVIPLNLCNFLCETPLKHLSLHCYDFVKCSEVRNKLVEVLSCGNLRNNLQSLTTTYCLLDLILAGMASQLTDPSYSAVFVNVTELTFDFIEFCSQQKPIDWLAFWNVFPVVKKILDRSWLDHFYPSAYLSQNVHSFCKMYLDASRNQPREVKIDVGPIYYMDPDEVTAAVAKAATLPEDQDWCVSHGVQIETETRDEKLERVTLLRDTSTLVFDVNYDYMDLDE